MGKPRPIKPIQKRFDEKYVVADTGCWLWTGASNGRYGLMMGAAGVCRTAHRVSYELHRGSIPSGLSVCHSCDVTLCVNPEHLFVGTHQENMQDCIDKGRFKNLPAAASAAKTHCLRGHEFTPQNTKVLKYQNGARMCRRCHADREAARRASRKEIEAQL